MRIYVSKNGDTLRKIASCHNIDVRALIAQNPHIPSPDMNLQGTNVNIPPQIQPTADQTQIPPCPFDPLSEPRLNNWIPLKPLEQMAETDYDVIIVGTGAGGGAVLRRLCERWAGTGKRIGVIERGDLLLPTHGRNVPTMTSQRLEQYWRKVSTWTGKSLPDYSGARELFALGGRTLFIGMSYPRMPSVEIAKWPVEESEINNYYNLAEQAADVTTAYTKGASIQEILLNRLQGRGYSDATDVPSAIDLQPTIYGQIHSDPIWSSISMLAYGLNRKPFDLAVNACAVQVLTEKGRTVGLKVMSRGKKTFFLRTKAIVLSGNTFETPRILLYSGIQGRAIGHYLTNHSFLLQRVQVKRKEFAEVLGPLHIIIPQNEARPYQIQMGGPGQYLWYQRHEQQPLQDDLSIGISVFGRVESRYENQVYLDPSRRDEYGVPEIQVQFSYSEKDHAIIGQMAAALSQVVSAMEASPVSPEAGSPLCLMPPGSDYHESCTCRMGDDPAVSATNRYGQIHGVSGLYVADNSVLPSIGATNPTLSTIALAIRTADYIAASFQNGQGVQA